MLESHLHRLIAAYLTQQPHTFFMKPIISNRRGIPDFIICHRGFLIFIECKTPRTSPRPLQTLTMRLLRDAGARGFTAHTYQEFLTQYTHLLSCLPSNATLSSSHTGDPHG